MKRLRVLHVGCGGMSHTWLTAAASNRGLKMVGLVDLSVETAEKRRREFGFQAASCHEDLQEALKETSPDVVFDCTVPEAHCTVTRTALRHGCHVLGEKPLATTMPDARRTVKAAQKAGRLYAVIQNRRYAAPVRAFSKFVRSGRIGKLTTLNSDFYLGAHFGGFRDEMENPLLLDMAIHTFDAARFICGAEPVAVYCKGWNPSGSWYRGAASAVAIFEMSDGLVFTYRGSWSSEGMNTSWESEWRAIGEKGSALWDGGDSIRAQIVKKTDGFLSECRDVAVKVPPEKRLTGHGAIIDEFLKCVRSGGTPQTICTDNIKSLAMVAAAVKSAASGRRELVRV